MRKWVIGSAIAAPFVSGIIVLALNPLYTQETVTFTVTDKERVNGYESSRYLVFTEDEVFQNTDSLLMWKFSSSDLYGSLEVGTTYEALVTGWRVPFLSWYRNIVTVEAVSE